MLLKRKGLWNQEWYPERLDQRRERNPAVLSGQRYFSECQKCVTYKQTGFSMKDSMVYIKKKKRKVSIFKEQEKEKANRLKTY